MLKRIYLSVLVAILGIVTSYAQQFKFGLQTGVNVSHLVYSVESDAKLGGYFGAFAEYRFGHSPWSVRLGLNWENNNTRLKNFNLDKPTQQIERYEITLHHLSIPLSVGYTFKLHGDLAFTPRVGIFHRQGITSCGLLTSYQLNKDNSDQPATEEIAPFEGASGVAVSRHNPSGTYYYPAFSKATYGIFGGVDLSLNKHWQFNATYKFGSGHPLTRSLKERGGVWLNSLDLGVSYTF